MTAKPPAPPPDSTDDIFAAMRRFTAARIGLARNGASVATAPLLDFRLAHARARDAVHAPLDTRRLRDDLAVLGLPVLSVASAVADRSQYLMRPDLGRRLGADAVLPAAKTGEHHDVVFVVADGLSALAVQTHAAPVLAALLPELLAEGWRIAPLVVVQQGRVAIGDAIAAALAADTAVVLIGERPGLSAPDSLGAYLTFAPGPATTDAERNCISNIRPEGIGYADAAFRLGHLLREMRRQRISGVQLKDTSERPALDPPA